MENRALAQEEAIGYDNTVLLSTTPLTELAIIVITDDKGKRKQASVIDGPNCIDDIDESYMVLWGGLGEAFDDDDSNYFLEQDMDNEFQNDPDPSWEEYKNVKDVDDLIHIFKHPP